MEVVKTRGARTHNVKNINPDLSRNRLTVTSGPSGSGKGSHANSSKQFKRQIDVAQAGR